MSTHTWSQYVAMEDANAEPGLLDAAFECIGDWDDEFDLGGSGLAAAPADPEDPE